MKNRATLPYLGGIKKTQTNLSLIVNAFERLALDELISKEVGVTNVERYVYTGCVFKLQEAIISIMEAQH